MSIHHLMDAVQRLRLKIGIAHLFFRQSSGVALLPDENPHLIAQVQKTLIIGIMRCAHRIGTHILDKLKVIGHSLQREGVAKLRMGLMTVYTLDPHWFSIPKYLTVLDLYFPKTGTLYQIVAGIFFPIAGEQSIHRVQGRRFRLIGFNAVNLFLSLQYSGLACLQVCRSQKDALSIDLRGYRNSVRPIPDILDLCLNIQMPSVIPETRGKVY